MPFEGAITDLNFVDAGAMREEVMLLSQQH
jgi:hypothetical protein